MTHTATSLGTSALCSFVSTIERHRLLKIQTMQRLGKRSGALYRELQCGSACTRRHAAWFVVEQRAGSHLWCEAGSDPRGHLWVTWGAYLGAGKPPLADIILSDPPDLTRCDSVIGLAIPAMSGHIQYPGAASGDLYIRISGINRVFLS